MNKYIYLLLISLLLSACGGGSGAAIPDSPPAGGTITGIPQLGIFSTANISIFDFSVGTRSSSPIKSITLDADGKFRFSLSIASKPILICVTNGSYIEESSSANVQFAPNSELCSTLEYISGENFNITITYFTHITYGLTKQLISTGLSVNEAIKNANLRIGTGLLSLDISKTIPVDITIFENKNIKLTDSLKYGFYNAGISSLTEWLSDQNNSISKHSVYNSIYFAGIAFNDIVFDGKLDGIGTNGALGVGVVPISTQMYRHDFALNLLVMANSQKNQTGLGVSILLPTANSINISTDPIFSDSVIISFNNDKPKITNVSLKTGDVIFGMVNLTFDVIDPTGLTSANLYLGNSLLGSVGDFSMAVVSFNTTDTTLFPNDGIYNFKLVATNNIGSLETYRIDNVTVTNQGISINNITPVDGSYIKDKVTINAVIDDPIGIKSIVFDIDGGSAQSVTDVTIPTITHDVTNITGSHKFNITVTNKAGVSKKATVIYIIDNIPPIVLIDNITDKSFWKGDGIVINGTVSDNTGIKLSELYLSGNLLQTFTSFPSVSYTLATSGGQVSDGVKTLVLKGTDNANSLIQDSRTITIDNTLPNGNINNLAINSFIGNNFTVDVTANDATSGIQTVEAFIGTTSLGTALDLNTPSIPVSISAIPEGAYNIKAVITDKAGNSTIDTKQNVFIDKGNPTFSISISGSGQAWSLVCSGVVVLGDTGSGVVSATVAGVNYSSNGTFNITLPRNTNATSTTFNYSVTDRVGHNVSGSFVALHPCSGATTCYCTKQ